MKESSQIMNDDERNWWNCGIGHNEGPSDFSNIKSNKCTCGSKNKTESTLSSSQGFVKLEIADDDIRE